MIAEAAGHDPRVEIDAFQGLLVDYVRRRGATVVLRGLRALADFEYEFQFAHMNRHLAPEVETMFLMTSEESFYVSSSLVKEVALMGGDVTRMVPPAVVKALAAKRKQGVAP
jgi:pantetheine-phosphate adenylyltransferase